MKRHNQHVSDWNARYDVGTRVRVTRDNGTVIDTFTMSDAYMLGTAPVILVYGFSGCYLLDRVTPLESRR